MRFILLQLEGAGSVDAKSVIDAAGREKISVATLTRATDAVAGSFTEATLGLDVGPAAAVSARFRRFASAPRRPHSESCCEVERLNRAIATACTFCPRRFRRPARKLSSAPLGASRNI